MDKLHKYAKEIISTINPNIRVRQSRENSYETDKAIIRLDLRDTEDCGFMRHLVEKHFHLGNRLSQMVWTILHEVGHHYTLDKIDDDVFDECLATKTVLSILPKELADANPTIQDMYFDLPDEWAATHWAVRYAKRHWRTCKKWSKELERINSEGK